jgi:hypothetical protein
MKTIQLVGIGLISLFQTGLTAETLHNPAIQYSGFVKLTQELEPVRTKNRVSEQEFDVKTTRIPFEGTAVLPPR